MADEEEMPSGLQGEEESEAVEGNCGDGEEGEEREEDEEAEEPQGPPEPTEEEILQAEMEELGIPTEEDLLTKYPFPEEADPKRDDSGRDAYRAKAKEFDFFMFPIESVTKQFDLTVLNLRHSGLGDKGATALAECLRVNRDITELSLIDNWITVKGGEALLDAIRYNTAITKLDISDNRLGYRAEHIGREGELGDMLFQLLQNDSKCKQLKSISLRANFIGDRDMEKICDALASNTWLHDIDFSYNELGPMSGKAIGMMLANNIDLRSANFEWNQLRGQGTFAVVDAGMMENNTLRRLNLSWNGVEDKTGEAFGQVLSKNGSLEEVDLSHNRIGEKGAIKIAEGLVQNQSLRRLILSFNPLKDGGCKAIVQAIRETGNTQLCYVDIKNSDAGAKAHEELQATKKQRPNVEIAVPRNLMVPKDTLPSSDATPM